MEKVLYATDELTGLIGAVALMRPSKSVSDLELKSVKKKYKNLNFAAGCSREVIERGAAMLGWELDDLISRTILAMRSCKKEYELNEQFSHPPPQSSDCLIICSRSSLVVSLISKFINTLLQNTTHSYNTKCLYQSCHRRHKCYTLANHPFS